MYLSYWTFIIPLCWDHPKSSILDILKYIINHCQLQLITLLCHRIKLHLSPFQMINTFLSLLFCTNPKGSPKRSCMLARQLGLRLSSTDLRMTLCTPWMTRMGRTMDGAVSQSQYPAIHPGFSPCSPSDRKLVKLGTALPLCF